MLVGSMYDRTEILVLNIFSSLKSCSTFDELNHTLDALSSYVYLKLSSFHLIAAQSKQSNQQWLEILYRGGTRQLEVIREVLVLRQQGQM